MEVETAEIPVIQIDTRTEEPLTLSDLKRALIKLLTDPEVRKQVYEAVRNEEAFRANFTESYK